MTDRTISAEALNRLRGERDEADRRYNNALTTLDRAIRALPEIPHPPPDIDPIDLETLNRLITNSQTPTDSGDDWRGWARRLIRTIFGPEQHKQNLVNQTLLHHLSQLHDWQRATARSIDTTLTLLGDELEALRTFQSILMGWAQQVTPYVDTKDREATALVRHANENPVRLVERTIGLIQQRQQALKREFERLIATSSDGDTTVPASTTAETGTPSTASGPLDAYKYVGFEEVFRGSEKDIAERLKGYCDRFVGASDVLDIGCGRGEFLSILRDRRISARGLDANREMVAVCQERGLEVEEGDAVRYLDALPDATIGGLIATQVVEHFRSDYLVRFLELAYHKLRPGSTIILETLNVDSWSAFFGPYLRDITHERPLPPETLRFMLEASGFQRLELQFSSPADETAKLQPIDIQTTSTKELATLIETVNANVHKINTLLFTFLDYAVIAQKL